MKTVRLLLLGGVVALGLHCASRGTASPAGANKTPAAVENGIASASLLSVKAETSPAPRILLETSGSPTYTSYSPQPDVFVVDLPRTAKASTLVIPTDLPSMVSSVSADEAVELGHPLTRVTIRLAHPATSRTQVVDNGVAVTFEEREAAAAPAPEVIPPEPAVAVTETEPAEQAPKPAIRITGVPEGAVSGRKATRLYGVETTGSGATLILSLVTDGSAEYKAFRLSNPPRIVIDLNGVRNASKQKIFPLGDPYVKQVRVAQFATTPRMVTRVVLDLDENVDYQVARANNGLRLSFGGSEPVETAEIPNPPAPTPAPAPAAVTDLAAAPASSDITAQIPPVAEAYVPAKRGPVTTQIINAPAETKAPATKTPPAPVGRSSSTEDVFIEPEKGTATTTLSGSLNAAGSRQLSAGSKVYTGEPIDLSLKDADLKDVLRLFAQLTGLNIAVDPQVTGTVTVDFQGVPWDQALELILKQNGLTFDLEGNVMRIGTVARLSTEQAQERKLEEDKRLNVPLTTISHKLSYAKAEVVQGLLRDMASPRGKIIVDQRTNQLIITEIPAYLQTMLNMIETIDIATPQVVIEARIVETTKNFARQLGVNWGFQGALDPALGTGTGLQFPNRINFEGGPFDFAAGSNVLSLTLGNVLGTFDLDLTLTAAESEGLVRIVSAPKVTTQDNEQADIESGVQIPLQTRVNFTTTVTYINATLRLGVRPQITEAGTVIMEIEVQKVEPALGLRDAASANSPLLTRRATTKLMVRDGGTTVIGGIYQATDNENQSRVPFLHEIPVLGNLFKNNTVNTRHDELLIFITPRIVRNM